jgi:esterase
MNLKLYTKITGQGPALLILHGLFGSWENWGSQARLLSEHFTVYAMDARNHGLSAHNNEIDYALMSGDVLYTLQQHGVEQASVIGHSMGGKTAMQLALNAPEFVQQLIIVDIAPRAYSAGHDEIFEALLSLEVSHLKSRSEADKHISQWIESPGIRSFLLKNLRRTDTGFEWKMNLQSLWQNYPKLIDNINEKAPYLGPTLFIKGAESNYIEEQDRAKIATLFPQAKAKIIAGAGHWPHSEKSAVFNNIATEFLLSNDTGQ